MGLSAVPEDYNPLLDLDPQQPFVITNFGRKGSGKSVLNRLVYDSWPFDKLCIDVNGNAEPGDAVPLRREDLERGSWPRPTQLLGEGRRGPVNLHYRADPGSRTYYEDLDAAVGVALQPQNHRVLVWCGEVGELMKNGRPGPNMKRLLQQNRHYRCAVLFDGPRPVHIDPLVMTQADLVAVYEMPNPADRERVANAIGFDPARFHEACHETWDLGDYNFVLWDARVRRLFSMAPVPLPERVAA